MLVELQHMLVELHHRGEGMCCNSKGGCVLTKFQTGGSRYRGPKMLEDCLLQYLKF
jgi:hypothetical protein